MTNTITKQQLQERVYRPDRRPQQFRHKPWDWVLDPVRKRYAEYVILSASARLQGAVDNLLTSGQLVRSTVEMRAWLALENRS